MNTWRRRALALLRNHLGFFVAGLVGTAVILAFLFGMFGLVHAESTARMVTLSSVTGVPVPVMQIHGVRCPREEDGGCAFFGWVTINTDGLASTDEHEAGHVAGGQHERNWSVRGNGDNCAEITQQGRSNWAVGMLLCRRTDGSYYQVAP